MSKPKLRKRGPGAGVVRREAFVQLAARIKTVAITEGNQLSAEQLADRVFNSFDGSFTNLLLPRNKLTLSKFLDAIPHLLRLAAVDPLEFIHLHRHKQSNGHNHKHKQSMETSTSIQVDTEFIEDEDFSVCSADEYDGDPIHILFEVSVQYPDRDLTISAPRVQFEVAPSTPSLLKAQAYYMIKTLLSAQIPTTSAN
eukprot:gene5495-5550_t